MALLRQPFGPGMDVCGFPNPIADDIASALAMTSQVGKQYGVAGSHEKRGMPEHSGTRVGNAVKKNDYCVSGQLRGEEPGAERDTVGSPCLDRFPGASVHASKRLR